MQFVKGAEEPTGPDIENNTSLGSARPTVAPGAAKQNSPGSSGSAAKFEKISECEIVDQEKQQQLAAVSDA